MATPPTANDLFEAARSEALIGTTKFDPAVIDTEGSDVEVVFRSNASMGEEVSRFAQLAFNEAHLSTSEGDALDRWVYDRYRLVRRDAVASTAVLTLSRTDTSAGFTVNAGTSFETADGVTFQSQTDVIFPLGNAGPFNVDANAIDTGEIGNVAAGKITSVASAVDDPTLAVTNEDPAAGGEEAETDEELRSRAQDFFLTARRGTREAIEFGATQTPGVAQSTATEVLDAEGDPACRVELVISDTEGQANAALATRVRIELDEFRALGVPVGVFAGVQQLVTITATGLQFDAGFNTSEVLENARNSILAQVNGLAPNTTLRLNLIEFALGGVDGLIVPSSAITAPAGDVVPNQGSVLRTTKDLIALNGT